MTHAIRAVGEGISANRWIAAMRESGTGVRRQVGLRVFGQAKALVAEYGNEPTRPLDSVPTADEMKPWPTRASSGVLQTVQLFYRERVTGRIVQRFYNVKSETGVTREAAVNAAIEANAAGAEEYEQEFIGGYHTGSARLVSTEAA